jgi:hypothetical protein
VGGDLHPFAAAVITESTAVLAATTHILCCSCAVSFFEDRYENALIHLLKKKQAGEAITPVRGVPPESVVNLMDTRRASIDAEKKKSPAPSTEARQPKKRTDQNGSTGDPAGRAMTSVELDTALKRSVTLTWRL